MASVREVSSIAEDLLCPVCLSIFQDPRMLGCGHNFCLSCLESCVIPKGQLQGTCPECRTHFDLQDASRNRVLSNLSEKARLLKLEDGPPSSGAGSRYFCEEHEEPLKLFCSQDEAPVCVICRDLPQHQGHSFLPFKNAVKSFQKKLKASQEPLEDGVKWATNSQSRQLEAIEELEALSLNLCGCIFIAFEELREILNEREQTMLETVKQMKEDNLAEMEGRLEHLKAYESSHTETISTIRATLEETNEFAFLKGIKALMGRIQDRLNAENDETGNEADEESQEEKESEGEKVNENRAGSKGDQAIGDEAEGYEEAAPDSEKDEDGAIVPVDPGLGELEESLDFETWKEMLRSIGIGETYAPDSLYCSPPPEEDMFPYEDTSEAAAEEAEAALEDSASTVEASSSTPGRSPHKRQSSGSNTAPFMRRPPYRPPLGFPSFPMPLFQQVPLYNQTSTRGWGTTGRWMPQSQWGCGMWPGRGTPQRQPFGFRRWQGRGYPRNTQMLQPGESSTSHPDGWRIPRREPPKPREAHVMQGGFFPNKQRPQASGSQSGGGSTKKEHPRPREAHVSGQGRSWWNKQRPQSSGGNGSSQSEGGSTKKEPPRPREAHAAGQGVCGQGQGSAKKPPTPHKGGEASSGSKRLQHRQQASHHGGRGCGQGSGSAKGPWSK